MDCKKWSGNFVVEIRSDSVAQKSKHLDIEVRIPQSVEIVSNPSQSLSSSYEA